MNWNGEALGAGRYPELTRFLLDVPLSQNRIALSLHMIEELLDEPMPLDAALPSWWANNPALPHARSWLTAGWEVEEMNAVRGVALVRLTGRKRVPPEPRPRR